MAVLAIMGPVDHIALLQQRLGQLAIEILVILNDQDSHLNCSCCLSWRWPDKIRGARLVTMHRLARSAQAGMTNACRVQMYSFGR
jgi:hypothetical protein